MASEPTPAHKILAGMTRAVRKRKTCIRCGVTAAVSQGRGCCRKCLTLAEKRKYGFLCEKCNNSAKRNGLCMKCARAAGTPIKIVRKKKICKRCNVTAADSQGRGCCKRCLSVEEKRTYGLLCEKCDRHAKRGGLCARCAATPGAAPAPAAVTVSARAGAGNAAEGTAISTPLISLASTTTASAQAKGAKRKRAEPVVEGAVTIAINPAPKRRKLKRNKG